MKPLALALLMLLAALPPAVAASPQSSQSQTVEVGAGTTDGTTTGSSGPQKSGPSGPNQPSASLCDDYQGETKASCLAVEMHKAPPDKGEAQ